MRSVSLGLGFPALPLPFLSPTHPSPPTRDAAPRKKPGPRAVWSRASVAAVERAVAGQFPCQSCGKKGAAGRGAFWGAWGAAREGRCGEERAKRKKARREQKKKNGPRRRRRLSSKSAACGADTLTALAICYIPPADPPLIFSKLAVRVLWTLVHPINSMEPRVTGGFKGLNGPFLVRPRAVVDCWALRRLSKK